LRVARTGMFHAKASATLIFMPVENSSGITTASTIL